MKVGVVGLGYFSQFHLNAWAALSSANLVGVADQNVDLAKKVAKQQQVSAFPNLKAMLAEWDLDIVDLVVPPQVQADLIRSALKPDRMIICQKPFCTSVEEAEAVVADAERANTRLVIHENFRFQPWYRTAKKFLDSGQLGDIYSARFTLRPGDGQGDDAYLSRQPSFQKMPRFLVQETAVHLIDTFTYLFGPIDAIYADLRRLNPKISGEDAGHLIINHRNGVVSTFDGNRLSDQAANDPRRTMGDMLIEGSNGALTLDGEGALWFRKFQTTEPMRVPMAENVDFEQFGGGCVEALVIHAANAFLTNEALENTGREYLDVLRAVETAYKSNDTGQKIRL